MIAHSRQIALPVEESAMRPAAAQLTPYPHDGDR